MPPWHVQENKWRAARYGLDADRSSSTPTSNERLVTDDLADLLERLDAGRRAAGLRGRAARRSPRSRARGASYQRQRAVAAETGGDLVAVVDSVVRELRGSLG